MLEPTLLHSILLTSNNFQKIEIERHKTSWVIRANVEPYQIVYVAAKR